MDLGGSYLRTVLVGADGRAAPVTRTPVPAAVSERADWAVALAAQSGASAVGLAVAGVVERGVVLDSVNLGVGGVDFGARLAGPGRRVVVVNDAVAAGVAEARRDARPDERSVLYVSVGTGIGGALLLDGSPVGGARSAGEVGHMVVDPAGPACGCGRRGCWETFCGGRALAAAAAGLDLDDFARADDPAFTRAVEIFALGLDNLCLAFAPDLVVLGGGMIARRGPVAAGYLGVTSSLRWGRGIRFTAASLGDGGGALGAALLAASA